MVKNRLIASIIVRDGRVVQSEQFKHTNVIHYDAIHAIDNFTRWSVDEIILINVSKDSSGQQKFKDLLSYVTRKCFVPITAGGWINELDYGLSLISSGSDKILINTALYENPQLVQRLIDRLGKQCIVASIDYRYIDGIPTVCINRGEQSIGIDPVNWANQLDSMGVGEIYLNCIDRDGKRKGYDLSILSDVCHTVSIPVIAFGGVFRWKHLLEGIQAGADAVAAANIFHYTEHATKKAKRFLKESGVNIREPRFIN